DVVAADWPPSVNRRCAGPKAAVQRGQQAQAPATGGWRRRLQTRAVPVPTARPGLRESSRAWSTPLLVRADRSELRDLSHDQNRVADLPERQRHPRKVLARV